MRIGIDSVDAELVVGLNSLAREINRIAARQAADGGWTLAPAYRAAVLPVRYGSRSLTTALCLEALAKYLER